MGLPSLLRRARLTEKGRRREKIGGRRRRRRRKRKSARWRRRFVLLSSPSSFPISVAPVLLFGGVLSSALHLSSPLSSPGFGPNRWEREKDETVNGADRGRHFSPSLLFPNSIAPSILLLPPPPSPPFPFFSYRKFSCAKGQKKLLLGSLLGLARCFSFNSLCRGRNVGHFGEVRQVYQVCKAVERLHLIRRRRKTRTFSKMLS